MLTRKRQERDECPYIGYVPSPGSCCHAQSLGASCKLGSFEYHPLLELDTDEHRENETSPGLAAAEHRSRRYRAPKREMAFFDNLKGWSKEKRYRYLLLLALSLSGDGW